jgi:hypothetical protein
MPGTESSLVDDAAVGRGHRHDARHPLSPRRIPEYRIDLRQGRRSKFLGLFAASECAARAQKRMGDRLTSPR